MKSKLFSALLIMTLVLASIATVASAAPEVGDDPQMGQREDNRPDPLTTKQLKLWKPSSTARRGAKPTK
jgi:hypothetical protein